MLTVVGRCIVKSKNKRKPYVHGFDIQEDFKYIGEHLIIYNEELENLMYIPLTLIKSNNNSMSQLKGYTYNANKFVIDAKEKDFKGKLESLHLGLKKNNWTILSMNEEAVKVINILGEINVISIDDFNKLNLAGRILNIWETKQGLLDKTKYKKLEGDYQLREVNLDEEDMVAIELYDELNKREESNEEVIAEEEVKEIGHKDTDGINDTNNVELELYKAILERIQVNDIISIPLELVDKLYIRVYKVLNSVYKEDGNIKTYRRIVRIRLNERDTKGILAITYYIEDSAYIKLQAFTRFEEKHNITAGDIEVILLKHQLELKYI